ncbi:MAG: acyl-CoA dehydrogenase family protein [Planctomycetota bacterium]|jgi:isovaleryl-CoA dehydrogenase|nr:acyl-CoA dehydrogenase family protein [Planctomycetota bacterium]MDP6764116.1 acyl-CoA dehydrogenase family protein [Planctomycetota bacterium]MDP6989595.1 acyl-CoA dehydrogenase family protein [Planctomycetota bacterium]
MNQDPTHEHAALRESVRAFVEGEVAPLSDELERTRDIPAALWRKLGALGLFGLGISETEGGSGGDMLAVLLAWEELAYGSTSVALSTAAHANLCAHNLSRNADAEQRARLLPGLLSGERIGALALTEPEAGSDAVGIRTTARRDGDAFVLDGSKTLITNAPCADLFLTYAKTASDRGAKGISAFVVERGSPGLAVSEPIEKMGCKASPTAQVFFNGCRVPAANLIGEEHGGIDVMMGGLDVERVVMSSLPIGGARRCLDLCLRYVREREQFGRPIGEFQLIQAKLADMYTKIEAARQLAHHAAAGLDELERGGKGTRIHKLSAAALLFAGEAGNEIAHEAVQIHGGYGFTDEYEVSRIYRDMRLATLGAGTSEMRRLIIARELLGV